MRPHFLTSLFLATEVILDFMETKIAGKRENNDQYGKSVVLCLYIVTDRRSRKAEQVQPNFFKCDATAKMTVMQSVQ